MSCFLVTTVFQSVTTVFVCVVFRKMWLLLWDLKELFPPVIPEQREPLGLEEQHLCLPGVWGLCWSDPWRAEPWFV